MELSERLTATELKLAEIDRLLAETIGGPPTCGTRSSASLRSRPRS